MTQVSKDFLEYFSEIYETTEDIFTLKRAKGWWNLVRSIFEIHLLAEN